MAKAKHAKIPDWTIGLIPAVFVPALLFSIIFFFQITDAKLTRLSSLAPGIPGQVRAVVAKALCKPVGQRFQTGADSAAALRACLARAQAPAG